MTNKLKKQVLLSFDTEEFDVPKEHGVDIPMAESMRISIFGTERILDCLKDNDVKATFFCTSNFVENAPQTMARIINEGHEVAAHGCDHWCPQPSDVKNSKEIIERLTGKEVKGYRQPRMFPVSDEEIKRCGYVYNSSLNPSFIPGKYMHLTDPRTCFIKDGVLQIPASVTPWVRFPLFWASYHHLPVSLYQAFASRVINHDGYFATYFHPWEFYPLYDPKLKIPYITRHNSGENMVKRLDSLIKFFKGKGCEFTTYYEFAKTKMS